MYIYTYTCTYTYTYIPPSLIICLIIRRTVLYCRTELYSFVFFHFLADLQHIRELLDSRHLSYSLYIDKNTLQPAKECQVLLTQLERVL